MSANFLTVAIHVSGYTWGTTMWVASSVRWIRLDSAIESAKRLARFEHGTAWRIYDTDGVIYAEGR